MKKAILLLLLFPLAAFAQVSVSLSPVPKLQFLSNSGLPLASGCVFFFQGGTNTPQAAYTDSTGTVQLPNPLILDAGGFSSPGGIWLANQSYKIQVKSAGGVNCASGTTQYTIDGISSALGLLNLANTWTAANTFQQPIAITPNSNQLVAGAPGNQTTLNFPAPAGNIVVTAPSVAGTLAEKVSDTFTTPTINSPAFGGTATGLVATNPFINGVNAQVGASYTIAATDEQKLVTFNNAGAVAVTLPQATTAGFTTGTSFHVRNLGVGTVTITPATSQIDGVSTLVLVTGQGADIYSDGANYFTQKGAAGVSVVGAVNLTAQGANIPATTIIIPGANGFYRISFYVVLTQAATTSSTLPNGVVSFTDADTNVAETLATTGNSGANTVGTVNASGGNPAVIYAKSGVAIQYSTANFASSGATPMLYAIHVRLEGPL